MKQSKKELKLDKMYLCNCLALKFEIIISKIKFQNFAKNFSRVNSPYFVFEISPITIVRLNLSSFMSVFDGDMDESSPSFISCNFNESGAATDE